MSTHFKDGEAMFWFKDAGWRTGGAAVLTLLLVASACGVRQGDLDTQLDQIRQEMRENHEALEQRLGEEIRSVEDRLEHRLAMLEEELDELRDEFTVAVERFENAIRFSAPVHFAFDDDTVTEEAQPILDRFAEVVLQYYDEVLITVEGFTDPAGPAEYNLQLGQRRAESVADYLGQAGIPSERMRAVSYGEDPDRQVAPGAMGPGEAGWQNRRVAMVVDFAPEPRPVVTDERHEP